MTATDPVTGPAPRLRVTVVEAGAAPAPALAAGTDVVLCMIDLDDAAALPRPGPDDVLVLDLRGAGVARIAQAMDWITAQKTRAPCVVVGPPGDMQLARIALRGGATAWLGRHASQSAVLAAVRAAAAGRLYLGSTGQRALCSALADAKSY